MNLKTTLGLVLLLAAGAGLFVFGTSLSGMLTRTPQPTEVQESPTVTVLTNELKPDKIRRIEVSRRGEPSLILESKDGQAWTLPGKWETRPREVRQLVELITGLETRFAPIAVTDEINLADYGLKEPPVTVTVKTDDKEYRLAFGEGQPDPGQPSRFARPTYTRLGDEKEIVRLQPGLVTLLDKPVDYYQQRRLFPAERVAGTDPAEKTEKLLAREVSVKEKKAEGGAYGLKKDGDDWVLSAPVRDRVDPDRLKTILSAVPDIWAEEFVAKPKPDLKEYGLDQPEQTIHIVKPDGSPMTLLVGKMSKMKTRTVMRPPPPGFPPGLGGAQPETVHEELRYAKLEDNDQIFEIKAEKLKDIFQPAETLRDARLARFRTDDATKVEIAAAGQPAIVLTKDKEKNRWSVQEPFKADAETSKITELLDKLSGLSAREKDIIDKADPKMYGLDQPNLVTVTAEEEVKGEGKDKKKVEKKFTFEIGKHDAKENRLYVQVKGWDRVNAVEENVLPLVTRPALAYRGRRVFDFATADLASIKVTRGGETLVLDRKDGKWALAEPVKAEADSGKASKVAGDLGNLEVVEYVTENAKPADLEPLYGLGTPPVTVTLTYKDEKKPAQTLQIGKARGDKGEYFAKLAGSESVFVVKKEVRDALDQGSLAYRPLQLWQIMPEDVAELRVKKAGEEEYRLAKKDGKWKVTVPFDAAAMGSIASLMADEVASLKADRYEAHNAKDLAGYGLDKPALTLTVVPLAPDGNKDIKERVLLVGKEAKEGGRYARLADGDAIVVIPDKLVAVADRGVLDVLDRRLLALDRDTIESVRTKVGDAKLRVQKGKDGWHVVESPTKPFPADRDAIDALVGVWTGLQAQKFAAYNVKPDDLAKYGLDKPAISVTATVQKMDKEENHTLDLGKSPEGASGEVYARLDNGPAVVVLPGSIANVLKQTYLDYVNRTILSFDPANVAAVVRQAGADNLELVKRDDGWYVVKPAEQRGDDRAVMELLRGLTGKALRVAAYPAEKADDLKKFGLDSPSATLTLRVMGADGKVTDQVLKLGKPVDPDPANAERFAIASGSTAVLVLPSGVVNRIMAAPLAFRNRAVVKFVDADKAILKHGTRTATFTKVDGTWKLTDPVMAEAEHNELDNLINSVADLKASELVAEKAANLKDYGLDKPEVQWRFQSSDKDVLNLLIGAREKTGDRHYAKLEGQDLVFLLEAPLTKQLLAEYRKRKVWDPPLDSAGVEEVRFTRGTTSFGLEKSGADWKVVGKADTKVNADAVNDTLAAIAGLKAEQFIADKTSELKLYGLDPPELAIELRLASGKRTLHVGRTQDLSKRYYARVLDKDRMDVFLISEEDGAKIVRDLPAFVQKSEKPAGP